MRCRIVRAVTPALLVAGLVVPMMAAPPASAATILKKTLSPNAPKLKLNLSAGRRAEVTFSGLKNEVVRATTTAGSYADNCDVMMSITKAATVVAPPLCAGQSGTTGDLTLPSDATYTIVVDTGASPAGSLKVSLTSSSVKKSITPNAPAITITAKATKTTDFGFIGTAGARLSATTAGGNFATPCNVHLSIIAPDGTTVVGSLPCAGQFGLIDGVDNLGAGTYKLRVENVGAVDGSVAIAVYQFADVNQPIAADGVEVTSDITIPGQNALLTFAGTVGQKVSYRVSTSNVGAGGLHLRRPDGSSVGGSDCIATNCFQDALTLDVTGTWAIVIDPSDTKTGTVGVQFHTFIDVDGGPIVPNGPAASLTISTSGQNGFFTFTGAVAQKVSYLVTSSNINVGNVHLERPDGSPVGSTCASANCFQDSVALSQPGTWKIVVDPTGSGIGTIHVELYTFTDVSGGAISANGAAASLTTTAKGQNGSFTFTGAVGQKVAFQVTASAIASGSVYLQRPAGTSVEGACIAKNCFQDSVTLDVAGTWKIVVDPGGVDVGAITVALYTFTDVNGGAIVQGGAAASLTLTTPGQDGFFTFTGAVGQLAGFQVTVSHARTGSVYFQRPDGTMLGGACIKALCTQAAVTLDAAGTWKIVVQPSGPATGSMSVKLT